MTISPHTNQTATHQLVTVPVGDLISQIPAATDDFPDAATAEHWRPRGCGIACLRMVLAANNVDDPGYYELITRGLQAGAYCDRGWIHQGLADLAASYSIVGRTRRGGPDDVASSLTNGHLITASVTVRFRGGQPDSDGNPLRPGGHLVIVSGVSFGPDETIDRFRVHHPSSNPRYNWSNHWIDHAPFAASFAGTFIEFTTPLSGTTDP